MAKRGSSVVSGCCDSNLTAGENEVPTGIGQKSRHKN
jgi:hypothetical protein